MGRIQTEKKPNANQEECSRKEMRARIYRYHEYIPLNVSQTDPYKEVGQVERFSKPKALKTRASTNKSLFCKYHNGFGYRTKDCYDFRDAMEQLIREGRLVKYIAPQRSF